MSFESIEERLSRLEKQTVISAEFLIKVADQLTTQMDLNLKLHTESCHAFGLGVFALHRLLEITPEDQNGFRRKFAEQVERAESQHRECLAKIQDLEIICKLPPLLPPLPPTDPPPAA